MYMEDSFSNLAAFWGILELYTSLLSTPAEIPKIAPEASTEFNRIF
jgi:hypothetical protein